LGAKLDIFLKWAKFFEGDESWMMEAGSFKCLKILFFYLADLGDYADVFFILYWKDLS